MINLASFETVSISVNESEATDFALVNLQVACSKGGTRDDVRLRTNLLPLEQDVTDRKEQDRGSNQACDMRPDDQQTLIERQRRAENCTVELDR